MHAKQEGCRKTKAKGSETKSMRSHLLRPSTSETHSRFITRETQNRRSIGSRTQPVRITGVASTSSEK